MQECAKISMATLIPRTNTYGGPLGPFQLHTANFEFLNFSLRNLTFLPSNFPDAH